MNSYSWNTETSKAFFNAMQQKYYARIPLLNNSRGASDSVKQKKVTVGQKKQSEKKKAANVGINKQKKKKKEYAVDNRVQCRGIGNWRWRSW